MVNITQFYWLPIKTNLLPVYICNNNMVIKLGNITLPAYQTTILTL